VGKLFLDENGSPFLRRQAGKRHPKGCWRPFGQHLMSIVEPSEKALGVLETCEQHLQSNGDILGKVQTKVGRPIEKNPREHLVSKRIRQFGIFF
jgi:hypothetical protein